MEQMDLPPGTHMAISRLKNRFVCTASKSKSCDSFFFGCHLTKNESILNLRDSEIFVINFETCIDLSIDSFN